MKPKSGMIFRLHILTICDQRVLLDASLTRLYGAETRVLKQAHRLQL